MEASAMFSLGIFVGIGKNCGQHLGFYHNCTMIKFLENSYRFFFKNRKNSQAIYNL